MRSNQMLERTADRRERFTFDDFKIDSGKRRSLSSAVADLVLVRPTRVSRIVILTAG